MTIQPMAFDGHATPARDTDESEAPLRRSHSSNRRNILHLIDEIAADIADRPVRVLELGAGTGRLFGRLNRRIVVDYTGVEPDPARAATAMEFYGDRSNFRMLGSFSADDLAAGAGRPDVVIVSGCGHPTALGTQRLATRIAALEPRLLVCSTPVETGPALWIRNLVAWLTRREREVRYRWYETLLAGLCLLDRLHPGHRAEVGFDWRQLARAIRPFMEIREIQKHPFRWLPAALALQVTLVAVPRAGRRAIADPVGVVAPTTGWPFSLIPAAIEPNPDPG